MFGIDAQWQTDLVELREFGEDNAKDNYFLIVIDIPSKYAWAKPKKTKTSIETASVFKYIFNKEGIADII